MILPYVLSQLLGALAASLLLRGLFPQHRTLGLTAPAGPALQSLILEIILTALLMFVILSVSVGAKESLWGSDCIGSAFCGPDFRCIDESGAPLGAGVSLSTSRNLWIYLVVPVTGALIAVVGCRCIRKDCCSVPLHGRIDQVS